MAEVGIATGAVGLPQQLIDFFVINPRKVAEWWDLRQNQPKDIRQLLVEIKNAGTNLSDLEKWVSEHVPEPHRGLIELSTSSLQQELSPLTADCVEVQKKTAKGLLNVFRSVPQKRLESIETHLSVIRTNLSTLANTLTSLPFNPSFVAVHDTVPSEHDKLHFNFIKNADGTFETSEGELYDAILNSSPPSPTVIVVLGTGGIGKTIALQEIGRRAQENNQQFKDGVLYSSIGQGAGVLDLIENLAELVKTTGGGEAQVQSIRDEKKVSAAIRLTRNWFKDRCCLFAFDDVWCTNGIASSIVSDLAGITNHDGSKLVFTTRDERLFMGNSKNITFAMKSDSDAQKILVLRSSMSLPESKDGRAAFDVILQKCGGLPIALSLAGAWIRQKKSESGEGVWELYLSSGVGSVLDGLDEWMKDSVVRSLQLADEETKVPHQFSFEASFPSFSIIREQQKVPIRVFERLWKLSKNQTVAIMKTLERFSLLEIVYSWKGVNVLCVALHDHILDVARTLSDEQPSDEPRPSQELIDVYTNYLESETGPTWLENFQWNWVSVVDDEFISENLFRLLADAGRNDASIWLTQEPAWIIKHLSKNGVLQVLKDIRVVEQYLQSELCRMKRDEKQSNRKLLSVVREICVFISKSDWEPVWNWYPWFQLYGRMISCSGERVVETFLRKVERDCPRPWLKPGLGCLPAAGTTSQTMISSDGEPLCQVEDNGDLAVVTRTAEYGCKLARYDSLGDVIFEVDLEVGPRKEVSGLVMCATYCVSTGTVTLGTYGGDVEIWRLSNAGDISIKGNETNPKINSSANTTGEQEENTIKRDSQGKNWKSAILRGEDDSVNSVAMSTDGARVVSGSHHGTVRVWEAGESGWESTVLGVHDRSVLTVAMSTDGARVVSGSSDQTARVWDRGDEGWEFTVLIGHTHWVQSVGISADGTRVVSGSADNTVRVWKTGASDWESTVLSGEQDGMSSVAMSANGARVVSSYFNGKVRVWESGECGWKATVLGGHAGSVRSITMSADGARVVSGSWDNTVRVWEAGESGWEANFLGGREVWAISVAVSADGARVVSGSNDGTVQMWKAAESGWESRILGEQEGSVIGVAISSDGARVVSRSYKTVLVWEAGENGWESTVLGGHGVWVISVAMSADGSRVVSGLEDNTLYLWEWQWNKWEGKEFGKFDSPVDGVNFASASGVITVQCRNGELFHWEDDTERWVEVGCDASEDGDASGKSGLPTKSQLKKICDARSVYKTTSGFCAWLYGAPYIGFVDWIK